MRVVGVLVFVPDLATLGFGRLTLARGTGAMIGLYGSGPQLGLARPLDVAGARVQVIARDRSTGDDLACWETTYTHPRISTPERFTALE